MVRRIRFFAANFWRAFCFAWTRLNESRAAQVTWHRNELMRLDAGFYIQEQGIELIRRREAFIETGGKPSDPAYPTFADLIKEAK